MALKGYRTLAAVTEMARAPLRQWGFLWGRRLKMLRTAAQSGASPQLAND
jgi:hypothetical protein